VFTAEDDGRSITCSRSDLLELRETLRQRGMILVVERKTTAAERTSLFSVRRLTMAARSGH